jgi:MOSC domain-containing protein YiiM
MNSSASPRIEGIFVSAGHNYFGHAGREPDRHPAVERAEAVFVAGAGIQGDRFFRQEGHHKGQVTFFAMEVFEEVRGRVGAPDCPPEAVRRNVFTRGVDLDALIGRRFSMQGVDFEGVEECRPCYWMDGAVGPGAEELMRGRGGLRARILRGGVLRAGQPAELKVEERSEAVSAGAEPLAVGSVPASAGSTDDGATRPQAQIS